MTNVEVIYRCQTEEEANKLCQALRPSYPELDISYSVPRFDIYVRQSHLISLQDYLSQREQLRNHLAFSENRSDPFVNDIAKAPHGITSEVPAP